MQFDVGRWTDNYVLELPQYIIFACVNLSTGYSQYIDQPLTASILCTDLMTAHTR